MMGELIPLGELGRVGGLGADREVDLARRTLPLHKEFARLIPFGYSLVDEGHCFRGFDRQGRMLAQGA
jgi:hypothetical protein